ncbi:hypothetical protein BG74_02830 [Sodalis-like endosymbiont of Proechinophthirus fluctus]|nr:hypothetical protein BG74_02830 [Sodalis-like endosymbiont of Proechinophthirus fluctus]
MQLGAKVIDGKIGLNNLSNAQHTLRDHTLKGMLIIFKISNRTHIGPVRVSLVSADKAVYVKNNRQTAANDAGKDGTRVNC